MIEEQTKEEIISSQTKDIVSEWSVLRTSPSYIVNCQNCGAKVELFPNAPTVGGNHLAGRVSDTLSSGGRTTANPEHGSVMSQTSEHSSRPAPTTVGVAECIAEAKRLKDQYKGTFSSDWVSAANEIISALEALQGKEIPASALASKAASEVSPPEDAITQEGNRPLRKTDAQGRHLLDECIENFRQQVLDELRARGIHHVDCRGNAEHQGAWKVECSCFLAHTVHLIQSLQHQGSKEK